MSFIITDRALAANGALHTQHGQIMREREFHYNHDAHLRTLQGNALDQALLAPRFWLDLDNATVELMGQEMDPLIADLMPLSKSVDIGILVAAYRKLGPIDQGETSLSGQVAKKMGNVGASYDGVVIPIYTKAFGREWRAVAGQRAMGYNDLADDQQAAMREVLRLLTENFVNGSPTLNYQGANSPGVKTNPNTLAITLSGSLVTATTYAVAQGIFSAAVNTFRGRENLITAPFNVYLSPEIEGNLNKTDEPTTIARTWLAALREAYPQITFKRSALLVGNQMLFVVPNRQYIQPVTGMAMTTTPIPRATPFDEHQFVSWMASGLLIKSDALGRSGVAFAST